MKYILALVVCINALDLDDDDGTNLLQTSILQRYTEEFDFDTSRWTQKDGEYCMEGHGNEDQCYPTLKEAMEKCDECGDCRAISTQSTMCKGQYRVSHQALGAAPTMIFWSYWAKYALRSWVMDKAATTRPGSIGVSSATCGGEDRSGAIALSCKGKTDCVVTLPAAAEPATESTATATGDFDFDRSRWTQKDGWYCMEGHGNEDQCYPTLKEAMEKCEACGTCKAITTASNLCKGQYRVSHQALGAAPIMTFERYWQKYALRSWVIEGAGPQGCKDTFSVTYSCSPGSELFTATISKPSEGKSVTLSCTTTTTTTPPTNPGCGEGGCNPDDGTSVIDKDCFDAEKGFGPDFSCATTEMYCGQDSGDGITVAFCCPDKCRAEGEKKRKEGREDKREEAEKERKEKRGVNEGKRKKAEKGRKKARKEDEWNSKRDQKEAKNKRTEGERKDKRNFDESKRKRERGWKTKRAERSQKANKRESARKQKRNFTSRKEKKAEKMKKRKVKKAEKKTKRKEKKGKNQS